MLRGRQNHASSHGGDSYGAVEASLSVRKGSQQIVSLPPGTHQMHAVQQTHHTFILPQAVRAPLDAAHEGVSLLQSLQPLWEEEAGRCGGVIPPRPPSPPRAPRPLCAAVEAVRSELAVGDAVLLALSCCALWVLGNE